MVHKTSDLTIKTAENGFVVSDSSEAMHGMVTRMWAFETPESLAAFILKWANDIKTPPVNTPPKKQTT